jgi:hypothetical protein
MVSGFNEKPSTYEGSANCLIDSVFALTKALCPQPSVLCGKRESVSLSVWECSTLTTITYQVMCINRVQLVRFQKFLFRKERDFLEGKMSLSNEMLVNNILAKETVVASIVAEEKLTKLLKSPKFGRYGTVDVWT